MRAFGAEPEAMPAASAPFGPVIYYRHPDDPVYSATPKKTDDGRDFVAVLASESLLPGIPPTLAERFGADVGRGAVGLSRAIAVLTPQEAKGLEFDAVIIAEPQRIVDEIPRGAAALYVSMTRPTQRLRIVTTGDLPVGIE